VYAEPLASSELPLWLHYSGIQASCHNMDVDILDVSKIKNERETVARIFRNEH
jgi:hypothetical protein